MSADKSLVAEVAVGSTIMGERKSPNSHPSPKLGTNESSPVAVSPVSIGPGPPPSI